MTTSGPMSGRGAHPGARRRNVVLVGVGTLGSPLLELVVRQSAAGGAAADTPGAVMIIDHDTVARHNIAKAAVVGRGDVGYKKVDVAAAWAAGVNPECHVVALPARVEDVGIGPFLDAAVVLIAADNYAAKIHASRAAWKAKVPLIMVGELAGEESLNARYRYYLPAEEAPCLECGYAGPEYARLGARFSCSGTPDTATAEGGQDGHEGRGPATRLSVAYRLAASMVEDCETILAILGSPSGPRSAKATGDGAAGLRAAEVRLYPRQRRSLTLRPRRNPECCFDHRGIDIRPMKVHQDHRDPEGSSPGPMAAGMTIGDAFAMAAAHLPGVQGLLLDQPVATRWRCPEGHSWSLVRRINGVRRPRCGACGSRGAPDDATRYLAADGPDVAAHQALAGDVVPPGDVLNFVKGESEVHLALPPPPSWAPGSRRVEGARL